MATTTTWNIMTSGNLWEFIQREAIRNFESSLFFKQTGKIVSLPFGMNKYTFPKVDNKDGAAIQLTEGVTPSETSFTLTRKKLLISKKTNLLGIYSFTISSTLSTEILYAPSISICLICKNGVKKIP